MDILWEMAYPDIVIEPKDKRNNSPLHLAALNPKCDLDLIKKMLDMGAQVNTINALGQSPLQYMIQCRCSSDIVKIFLDNGAFINAVDDFRASALHYAVNGIQYNLDIARLLLEGGANVHEQNKDDEVPLHLAARSCSVDVINLLLENEANVNALDGRNQSPLHHALNAVECDPKVIKLLLDSGVNIFQKNAEGEQALHLAAYKCNAGIVQLLLDNGALVDVFDYDFQSPLNHALNAAECSPEVVNLLLDREEDIHKINHNGEQILHLAAYKCSPDIIQLLLDRGASVNALDFSDRSPLHFALSINGSNPEVVELLVNNGSNLSQEDSCGQQPLHLAAFRSDPDTVKLLLDHGASPNVLNKMSRSPLLNAVYHNDVGSKRTVLKLLLESGAKVYFGQSPTLAACSMLNEEDIRTDSKQFKAAFQSAKLLIKFSLLEKHKAYFKGVCTNRKTDKSLLHFNRACLVEIGSKCPDRDFGLGEFLLQQRANQERDINEILRVLSKKQYPLYKEVLASLLTKKNLRETLEGQIQTIGMNCLRYKIAFNHVVLNHYISDHEDLLNLSLAFYGISQFSI